MLDAFADREHVAVGRHEVVVDMDAATDREPRLARQPDVRADADRHDDERGGDVAPVLQPHALDLRLCP